MIKIEFPADRPDLAAAFGRALLSLGRGNEFLDTIDQSVVDEEEAPKDAGAPSATDQTGSGEALAPAGGASMDVDEKGVPFNPEFCGKAAIPFYGTGKKKGQWKKRQGVEEDAYDEWYATELMGHKIVDTSQDETTSDSNVAAGAFGRHDYQPDANVPQDAGQLMKWISEQQAAGNIDVGHVNAAYSALKLPFDAIMNPSQPVAQNCAAIYHYLSDQIA